MIKADTALAIKPLKGIPEWGFHVRCDPSFRFVPDPHEYYLNGQRLWSPSGVFLNVRYVDPTYYTEESRYRGTYVHHATHLIDLGNAGVWNQVDHNYLGYVEAYAEFKEAYRFRPRMSEVPIYCPAHTPFYIGNAGIMLPSAYATTPDVEGMILDGDEAIVEKKTGNMPWWTAIQTASHDMALRAWDKRKNRERRRFGVELKANGKFRVEEFIEEDYYFTWWAAAKATQRRGPPTPGTTKILSYN